ncbi:hypothetical protein ADICEAN_03775 [Cesiribacter andamanensis AMV16]|uniref:Uncharacterized protein n=1 Tax=Cesiribacter andamanensis AMV16 TaxID=1279009 RepID=M7NRG3_9BACT|nr:hypothetical protein ADICEAN_03775 [Cesiribacter andamanensis AMV16]
MLILSGIYPDKILQKQVSMYRKRVEFNFFGEPGTLLQAICLHKASQNQAFLPTLAFKFVQIG